MSNEYSRHASFQLLASSKPLIQYPILSRSIVNCCLYFCYSIDAVDYDVSLHMYSVFVIWRVLTIMALPG